MSNNHDLTNIFAEVTTPKPQRKLQVSSKIFSEQANLIALIKAVQRFFPWEAPHGKKEAAWENVCEDVNKYFAGKRGQESNSINWKYAKQTIENCMADYEKILQSGQNGANEYISGKSFADPAVTAEMETLINRKKEHDAALVWFSF